LHGNRFILGMLFVVGFMHVGIFRQPVIDWDEVVYMFLSDNMGWDLANYTTRGSIIDKSLPQSICSSPVFYHPPLVPYMLKIVSIVCDTHMAAKILNILFIFSSVVYIYLLSLSLSGPTAAVMTTAFWVVCPIFNLESNIVHLDFPMTVLILAGICHWGFYQKNDLKKKHLALSGTFFALAMLTKFTGPIYCIVPVLLVLTVERSPEKYRNILLFSGIIALGFSWWIYIIIRFGTLMPSAFLGGGINKSKYMISIAKRDWYHIWLYFTCIFPLFVLYLCGICYNIWALAANIKGFFLKSKKDAMMVAINSSSILCVLVFSIINTISNKLWTFRHMMPFFPIVYITVGHITVSLFRKNNGLVNSYILTLVLLTFINMCFSSCITLMLMYTGNLTPFPALFFLIDEFRKFFY
ncbi:MAG TPA: hypothetical protein EYP18_09990, partial [Desulfobacterales bacterium]|nr:hypothetical protein [Desulfobacterales bacterium]